MFEREVKRARAIPLTSLIDVVFLLIVFFMLSSSFVMSESMELLLPSVKEETSDSSSAGANEAIYFLVLPDGRIELDGSYYTHTTLKPLLERLLKQDPNKKIMLMAEEKTSVQQLVDVLDVAYFLGAKYVELDHVEGLQVDFNAFTQDEEEVQ